MISLYSTGQPDCKVHGLLWIYGQFLEGANANHPQLYLAATWTKGQPWVSQLLRSIFFEQNADLTSGPHCIYLYRGPVTSLTFLPWRPFAPTGLFFGDRLPSRLFWSSARSMASEVFWSGSRRCAEAFLAACRCGTNPISSSGVGSAKMLTSGADSESELAESFRCLD